MSLTFRVLLNKEQRKTRFVSGREGDSIYVLSIYFKNLRNSIWSVYTNCWSL